jgi:hypothetical protein
MYFPKPVLGDLLLILGISFVMEWVYDAYFKLSKIDYYLVLLILVVTTRRFSRFTFVYCFLVRRITSLFMYSTMIAQSPVGIPRSLKCVSRALSVVFCGPSGAHRGILPPDFMKSSNHASVPYT